MNDINWSALWNGSSVEAFGGVLFGYSLTSHHHHFLCRTVADLHHVDAGSGKMIVESGKVRGGQLATHDIVEVDDFAVTIVDTDGETVDFDFQF